MNNPVFFVHGYDHDPEDPQHSAFRNPDGAFSIWTQMIDRTWQIPIEWYSGRQFKDLWKAWRAGHLTTYSWAYNFLAEQTAERLLEHETTLQGDVICHSLGSRVVLRALERRPNLFRRVIFLNGAETVKAAVPVIRKSDKTAFLNISVSTDNVLGTLGAWFEPEFGKHQCIGYQGIGDKSLNNLVDVMLDNQTDQQFFQSKFGWKLRGDDPDEIGDHKFSYLYRGNWPLYRKFLRDGHLN